jgi:internalin A
MKRYDSTLVSFITLAVIVLSRFADASEDEAVAAVKKLGGRATLKEESFAKPVVSVDLAETGVDDDALKVLPMLSDLEILDLSKTQVTNAGLTYIAKLTRLRALRLSSVSGVTDEGLAHFKNLKHLERLDLQGTAVTGSGIPQLADLPNLRSIHLSGARITDESMEQLESLKSLEELLLAYTNVSDAGLQRTGSLPRLRWLHIRSGRITDVGLMALSKAPKLELLQIPSTPHVTAAGVDEFRLAMPNVKLMYAERSATK